MKRVYSEVFLPKGDIAQKGKILEEHNGFRFRALVKDFGLEGTFEGILSYNPRKNPGSYYLFPYEMPFHVNSLKSLRVKPARGLLLLLARIFSSRNYSKS